MASGSITSKCWPHLTHSTEFLLCIAKTEPPHFPRSIDGFGACELQSAANSFRIVVALSSAAPTAPSSDSPDCAQQYACQYSNTQHRTYAGDQEIANNTV